MTLTVILQFLKGALMLLLPLAVAVWFVRRTIRTSTEPRQMRMKWCITIAASAGILIPAVMTGPSLGGAFIFPVACAALGIVLSLLWAPHLASLLAKPITAAIDGGSQEYEARPCYSSAIHQRKLGHYPEAIRLIREELSRFPREFQGEMMLAAIHAEDLKDMDAARSTVEKILLNPRTSPSQTAGALSTLADWQLSHGRDRDMAREALQQIVDRLPDTEFALHAKERMAHLASHAMLNEGVDRPSIPMREGLKRVGLMKEAPKILPEAPPSAARAQTLVTHLTEYPEDAEAREQLARLYADEYHRPDMAISELEFLIAQAHQPAKRIVGWLHMIADIHVKHTGSLQDATAALQRIIDMNPELAPAESARSRISRLKLELKAGQTPAVLTLGEYEQRLGLKSHTSRPRT